MKKEFIKYFNVAEVDTVLEEKRIEWFVDYLQRFCPDEIEDIFITNYVDEQGVNHREHLWCFGKNYHMEAINYLSQINYDISIAKDSIPRLELNVSNFESERANENSRLTIKYEISPNIYGELRAARKNCQWLWSIYKKYLLSNLVKP